MNRAIPCVIMVANVRCQHVNVIAGRVNGADVNSFVVGRAYGNLEHIRSAAKMTRDFVGSTH